MINKNNQKGLIKYEKKQKNYFHHNNFNNGILKCYTILSNYELLLNQGYSKDFLDNLTEESMEKMIGLIGDGYISDIQIEEKNLYDNSIMTLGNIDLASMALTITSGVICQYNTNKITCVLVSANWEWAKNKPVYRGKDGITINWNNNHFSYAVDTFYAQDLYKSNANDKWSIFKETNILSEINQGGLGFYTDLKAGTKYVGGNAVILFDNAIPMIKGNT